MIRRISGTVIAHEEQGVVVDIQGIGYLVYTTDFPSLESFVTFYTYLAVRENAMDLYGFESEMMLEMFELLLSVPKIGPKSALQILSQSDVTALQKAIINEDPSFLTKVSGIGKKTAENIVMTLKGKLDAEALFESGDENVHENHEIIEALITLGYAQKDAREALKKVPDDVSETRARIAAALKLLSS
ncbi:Holliday junction branch migration protein RuvA [Candidatus Kaiserbacteria bacterium]|nr:Holliday junction branch migration protein RuvA [Candidatus Kaiserbacteria bacterium]